MCAIHQPNLFPRLSTLAKLFAADRWIVLDDVQFARRDYQHRVRLAALDDPRRSRRTVELLVRQYYGRSRHWAAVPEVLEAVLNTLDTSDCVADVAKTSTIALLTALGWSGKVLDSSEIPTRQGRSERLADLAAATGGTHYLCGTGGKSYLDSGAFDLGVRT
ncbi:WbqC family protein [Streptomyces sp. NPDC001816]|uniref:WbqC family protein n=1 Tax=Streptomyces sp. NPDC001816 TaxID=3364612 RepID=UPI0036CA9D98